MKRMPHEWRGIRFLTVCFANGRIELSAPHSSAGEDRWNVIGMVDRVLFVVYTEVSDDTIRIISARAAKKEEIDEYFSD